jgi:hypothetical protein
MEISRVSIKNIALKEGFLLKYIGLILHGVINTLLNI